ncbi:MAG: histidinol dehydrogenase [Clostridiales bacterium]|nr:histidinol dehydrogenase [Clostridiales bacterium]
MIKIYKRSEISDENILIRNPQASQITETVSQILNGVHQGGDKTLLYYCEMLDNIRPEPMELTKKEIKDAIDSIDENVLTALKRAADRIKKYHSIQQRKSQLIAQDEGIILMQKEMPIEKVGIYIPGGTASYPSTVLMNVIPAKLAGVNEIVMVSPPTSKGTISPIIIAAAGIAGVDRIFRIGGAQAIAALAYGTESIPKVDKIVGPGNAYVAEAKKQIFGQTGIDMIAGPSEILVIADKTGNPAVIAADMLAQAEHDKMATSVLVTDSEELAVKVQSELEVQVDALPRKEIAAASINDNGKIIIEKNIDAAIDTANLLAPEHLELFLDMDDPFKYISRVRNAGSVFMGKNSPEALGDYYAGPNHTLPTGGTARFSSPLSVDDFMKRTSFIYYNSSALAAAADDIALLARVEGLEGHARSVLVRK